MNPVIPEFDECLLGTSKETVAVVVIAGLAIRRMREHDDSIAAMVANCLAGRLDTILLVQSALDPALTRSASKETKVIYAFRHEVKDDTSPSVAAAVAIVDAVLTASDPAQARDVFYEQVALHGVSEWFSGKVCELIADLLA